MDALAAFMLLVWCCSCNCFNVDTKFPVLYSGPRGSYFGYTVALHKKSSGPVVLAGAPRANSTTLSDPVYEPGALYQCNATKGETKDACKEIALLKEGNVITDDSWDFKPFENKNGMWLGVSLDVRQSPTQRDTVVCGHLWKNARFFQEHYVNGVCYVIDSELNESSVRKLLPLVEKSRRFRNLNGYTEYYFAYGQAGMSAIFTENGSNLILGAPGILSWIGSLINYPVYTGRNNRRYDRATAPDPPNEVDFNSYFGYSVTSGKFFQTKNAAELNYAVGAPRDAQNHGMVYVVTAAEYRLSVVKRKKGDQLGEYFGASVLGVDLNADSYTDLLVGAPLFSLESAGDEGKVYVYISNKNVRLPSNDLQKYTEIAGDRKPSARFGTAIASIGDINQDGFNDVAIGAPYEEGQGAVYIYHGAHFGLNSRYEQKIEASSINRKLKGFGIHISRALDIDDNNYPDIVVGSYASANAVLFRSKPVVNVFPMLNFNPKQILTHSPCVQGSINLTCVQVDACLRYNGEHVPSSLEFQLIVQIQDQSQRAFFVQNENRKAVTKRNMVANIDTTDCFAFTMFLYPGIKDVITPIQVQFSHKLNLPSNADKKFMKSLPVYHPKSLKNITSHVPFQTGCGKADECLSNLIVSVTRLYPPANVEFITLGVISNISLEITVRNVGEPAYLSELHIYLPSAISSINQDICEGAGSQRNATLICELGNPLRNNSEVRIHVKLDTTKIPPHTKYLKILFEAVTISTDTDPEDNTEVLPIFPETVYDIGVTGISSPDQVMNDGTDELPAIISHYYIIRNYGPSPLQTVYFSLHIPSELLTSDGLKSIISVTDVKTDQRTQNAVPVSCDETSLNIKSVVTPTKHRGKTSDDGGKLIPEDFTVFNATSSKNTIGPPSDMKRSNKPTKEDTDSNKDNPDIQTPKMRSIKIDCQREDIRCVELRCFATSFTNLRKYAEIAVSFHVNFTVLDKYLGPWYHIAFLTNGSIMVNDEAAIKQNVHPDITQVKTDLLHEGPPPAEELQSWIIFVSIGVGILLLIIILILLIKKAVLNRAAYSRIVEWTRELHSQILPAKKLLSVQSGHVKGRQLPSSPTKEYLDAVVEIYLKIGFFRRKEKDKMRKLLSESKRVKKPEDKEPIKDEDYCETEQEPSPS